MNLLKLLNKYKSCPICNSDLILNSHTTRHAKIFVKKDYLCFSYEMRGLVYNDQDYVVQYSLSLGDNSFYVDFYKCGVKYENSVPLFLLNKFKTFNENMNCKYNLVFNCDSCNHNYSMNTYTFYIDLKKSEYGDVSFYKENFRIDFDNDEYYLIVNYNDYSLLHVYMRHDVMPPKTIKIQSSIPFTSLDGVKNKIRTLVLLS